MVSIAAAWLCAAQQRFVAGEGGFAGCNQCRQSAAAPEAHCQSVNLDVWRGIVESLLPATALKELPERTRARSFAAGWVWVPYRKTIVTYWR